MKKKLLIALSLLVSLSIVVVIVFVRHKPKDFFSYITLFCEANEYSQKNDIGYLTITFDDEKHSKAVIKVKDRELQAQLSQDKLSDIIGANIALEIPGKFFDDLPFNIDMNNICYETDAYDYMTVVSVSYK